MYLFDDSLMQAIIFPFKPTTNRNTHKNDSAIRKQFAKLLWYL